MGLKKDPLTRCAPSTWNVQSVTDMSTVLFESNCDGANQPAIEWGKLTNGVSHDDINAWDVAKVTNMIQMFDGAAKFNQPLSSWNVAKVTKTSEMFKGSVKFNQPLNSWNVAKVTLMNGMFANAGLFSQEIGSWNTAEVINMNGMFDGAAKFKQNLNDWDVGKVTGTNNMFLNAAVFNAPLNAWNVAELKSANAMFKGATLFNAPLNAWNVAKLEDADSMFEDAAANQGVSADYGLVETNGRIDNMFKGTTAMSDCNKKAIHNKFEAAPRSLNFDFDVATNTVLADRSDWKFPGLAC